VNLKFAFEVMIVSQPSHLQQQHSNVDMQRSQPATPGPIVVAAPVRVWLTIDEHSTDFAFSCHHKFSHNSR
jgi:hypothetical protein